MDYTGQDSNYYANQNVKGANTMTKEQKKKARQLWVDLADAYYKINKKIGWDKETQEMLCVIADASRFCCEISQEGTQ